VSMDTCTVRIRIHRTDESATVVAVGKAPADREVLEAFPHPLIVLVFEGIEPDPALARIAALRITFDGRHDRGRGYSYRHFASLNGELLSVEPPQPGVNLSIDAHATSSDADATRRQLAWEILNRKVQRHFEGALPLALSWQALQLDEIGEVQPWHRQLGTVRIGGVPFHVDAIAVKGSPVESGVHEAVAYELQASLNLAALAHGTENGFQTLKLPASDGREHDYVLFLYPHDRWGS
jgi:hypothetical protein